MAIGSGEEDDVSIGTQSHSGRGVSSGGVVSIGGLVGEYVFLGTGYVN